MMVPRSAELLRLHSSSSSENTETVLSDDIIGPALPPIEGSAKRLFLVRHGEVINPGERKQGVGIKIKTVHLLCA